MSSDQTRCDVTVLEALDYPPKTKTIYQVQRATELPEKELCESLARLHEACLINEINGWIFRVRQEKREPLTRDDLEWLTGTGRFRQ